MTEFKNCLRGRTTLQHWYTEYTSERWIRPISFSWFMNDSQTWAPARKSKHPSNERVLTNRCPVR